LRRWLIFSLKIGVTIAALAWALSRTSVSSMLEAVGRMSAMAPAAAVLLLGSNIIVGAVRWREVIRAYGVEPVPPLGFLIHGYLVAGFYNTLVPGNVGGDALRGHAARSAFSHAADSYVAVLVERGLGFAALIVLAGVGAWLSPAVPFWWAGPALVVVGAALVAVSIATPWLMRKIARWLPSALRQLVGELTIPRGSRPLFVATLWSFVAQIGAVLASHVLVRDLDPHLRLVDSLAFIPIASLSLYVPISLAGLGVREAAFVVLLGRVGVSPANATAASLAFMASLLVLAALGGVGHALRPLVLPDRRAVADVGAP
jgi:glycosyltransferase 2 family protein